MINITSKFKVIKVYKSLLKRKGLKVKRNFQKRHFILKYKSEYVKVKELKRRKKKYKKNKVNFL